MLYSLGPIGPSVRRPGAFGKGNLAPPDLPRQIADKKKERFCGLSRFVRHQWDSECGHGGRKCRGASETGQKACRWEELLSA
jgi:hypothetical protein